MAVPARIPAILLVLCAVLVSLASGQGTIEEVLRNGTQFSNFVDSLKANDPSLLERLGNATVESTAFAPVNQGAPFNLSSQVLEYHVASHSYSSSNLTDGALVPSLLRLDSLNGNYQQLKVSVVNKTVAINGIEIKELSIKASNGLVHGLSSVLPLPGPLAEALASFSTLKSLLALANATLPDGCTLFAPTDDAFIQLRKTQPALYGYLTSGDNSTFADLGAVLKYHVLKSLVYAGDIQQGAQQVDTLEGQPITITKTIINDTVSVTLNSSSTSASVEAVNTLASDGVLHTINAVLVPGDFQFTLKKVLLGLDDTTLLSLMARANLTKYLNGSCTIFAPSQEAWQKAEESDYSSPSRLVDVLSSFIYLGSVSQLSPNMTLTMLNNKTLHVGNDSTLTLIGEQGSAHVIGSAIKASNGFVYSIDQVLGVSQVSNSGLSKATIGWIIVGGMGGILLLAAIIVAAIWLVKRKRSGYETINGDYA